MDQRVGAYFKESGVASNQNCVRGRKTVLRNKRQEGGVSPFKSWSFHIFI